jgi:hypothetical protein
LIYTGALKVTGQQLRKRKYRVVLIWYCKKPLATRHITCCRFYYWGKAFEGFISASWRKEVGEEEEILENFP